MNPTCAIVGANGFLALSLIQKLASLKYKITAVYNKDHSNIPEYINKIQIEKFIKSRKKYNFIVLAIGNYKSSHAELIAMNLQIQKIMQKNMNAKIVFISSTNVYGVHDEIIKINSSFNNPVNYALSKLAGEFLVSNHDKYAIIRLTYLYGKGLDNGSFLPNIIQKSADTGKITLFGNGLRKQDYLHLDDAVDLCVKALESKKNGVFLGASGVSVTNKYIAEIISSIHASIIEYKGDESGASFSFNINDTREILNWNPKVSIEEGLKEMLQ